MSTAHEDEQRYRLEWHTEYQRRHTKDGQFPAITPRGSRHILYVTGAIVIAGVPHEPPDDWGRAHQNQAAYWQELRLAADSDYRALNGQTARKFAWPLNAQDWRWSYYGSTPMPTRKGPPERGGLEEPDHPAIEARLRAAHQRAKDELARLYPQSS
jgi:hypothetical protein